MRSLMKCLKCQKEISSEAEQCPNCGMIIVAQSEFSKSAKSMIRIFALLGFIATGLIGFAWPPFLIIAIICLLIAIVLK